MIMSRAIRSYDDVPLRASFDKLGILRYGPYGLLGIKRKRSLALMTTRIACRASQEQGTTRIITWSEYGNKAQYHVLTAQRALLSRLTIPHRLAMYFGVPWLALS